MDSSPSSLPAILADLEVDVIEMTVGCAEQCAHCSESPAADVRHAQLSTLLTAVEALVGYERRSRHSLFGNYWYPFPASDPFSYPRLFELCDGIWRMRALPVYLLSLGWNRGFGAKNARKIGGGVAWLFRIAITVSNFSRFARQNPRKHRERLAASLLDLRPLWSSAGSDGKPLVLLSPQYVSHAPDSSVYSAASTRTLLEEVCRAAQLPLSDWIGEGRIHPRPVIGLGRATSELNVCAEDDYSITAENPCPPLSNSPERSFSGLVTFDGELAVIEAPRGRLGRERMCWTRVADLTATISPQAVRAGGGEPRIPGSRWMGSSASSFDGEGRLRVGQ